MKEHINFPIGRITRHAEEEGENIELRLQKMVEGKEPIDLGAQIDYTERKQGVLPEYDIRTDRFELAMKAMNKAHASNYASRMTADGYVQNEKGDWVLPEPAGEA